MPAQGPNALQSTLAPANNNHGHGGHANPNVHFLGSQIRRAVSFGFTENASIRYQLNTSQLLRNASGSISGLLFGIVKKNPLAFEMRGIKPQHIHLLEEEYAHVEAYIREHRRVPDGLAVPKPLKGPIIKMKTQRVTGRFGEWSEEVVRRWLIYMTIGKPVEVWSEDLLKFDAGDVDAALTMLELQRGPPDMATALAMLDLSFGDANGV
ncbi:hypothetical protein DFH27DRAFT_524229 [Peziza echinospora]|nr:hypothetical protein DFH27DRAFT_524229 [Peziza echinospora]